MPRDKGLPYFPFYPDDFAGDGDVEAMTTEEVGAYILLLCKAWRERPPATIPEDDRTLARWTRLSSDRWEACRSAVLAPFRRARGGRLYQPRLRSEWRKLSVNRSRLSEAGRRGGETKARNRQQLQPSQAKARLRPGSSKSYPDPDPVSSPKTETSRRRSASPVHRVTDAYHDAFVGLHGKKPAITSRDTKAVKELLGTVAEADAISRIPAYLALDGWWAEQGWPLRGLADAWNELEAGQPRKPRGPQSRAERDAATVKTAAAWAAKGPTDARP